MSTTTKRRLVAVTILALALVEPLTHGWIQYIPGDGYAPSGIHTGDSGHHLVAMRAFATDFYSPYVVGMNNERWYGFHYFATPFFLMYAVFGAIGHLFGASMFLWLGVLNGIGGALMLCAAYTLLRVVVPRHAENAFFLYALSGGLGGALYLIARATGWYHAPGFEDQFYRFAVYDLIEGQHRSPLLLFPRLYYTLPMAAAYAALALLIGWRGGRRLAVAGLLLALATFINLRVGPMACMVAAIYLVFEARDSVGRRVRIFGLLFGGSLLGIVATMIVSRENRVYYENVAGIGDQVTWFLPLLYATLFLWPGIVVASATALRRTTPLPRALLGGLVAYLTTLAVLIIGYHLYYGNYLAGGDTNAAVRMTDFAAIAILPGLLLGWRWRPRTLPTAHAVPAWLAVWTLGFLALTLSAGGGGSLISATPQRFLLFAALPMAAMAALGFDAMRPVLRRTGYATALGFGLCSLTVGALCFQGPLGHTPGQPPFGWLHYERILASDAELLADLPPGRYAVPPWSPFAISEVLAQRPAVSVFSGPGAMNLGGAPFAPVMADLSRFWDPATPDLERNQIAVRYYIEYVYVPDTTPPNAEIRARFASADWLEKIAESGDATLYRFLGTGGD